MEPIRDIKSSSLHATLTTIKLAKFSISLQSYLFDKKHISPTKNQNRKQYYFVIALP